MRAWLAFSIGVAGIAFAAIFVRVALPAPPVVTGFYRMAIATALVGGWLAVRARVAPRGSAVAKRPFADRRSNLYALAAGVSFGTDIALWNTSLVWTSVATATLLVNLTPVYVGLFAVLVWRESLDRRLVAGALLAMAGMAVLVGRPDRAGETLTGAGLALAAGLFYAGYLLFMSAARRKIDAVAALFLMSASAAAVCALYAALARVPFSGFPLHSWAAMAGAAVVSQLAGVMGIVWSLRYLPATVASVALLGQPLGAAALAWILLDEPIGGVQALGGSAVLVGIALASRASPPPRPGDRGRAPESGVTIPRPG